MLDSSKYIELHEVLMKERVSGKENILNKAEKIGYDKDKLDEKMESNEVLEYIQKTRTLAQSIGVSGTPAFVIAGEFVPGAISYEEMKKIVESAK